MTMRYSPESEKTSAQPLRAAIFVDYENLFSYLHGRIGSRGRPEEFINELLEELRRYLLEEVRTQTAMTAAYADFSEMHGSGQFVQRALYLQGIEPRFVPMTLQRNAAEIQLCVDAVDTLYSRPDITSIVMVTGDRRYLPLVQQIKRHGNRALIATVAPPPSTDNLPGVEDDVFLNAVNLLSESSRRMLSSSMTHRPAASSASTGSSQYQKGRPEPVEYRTVTDEGAHRALEIIEEHFGQYEEIYLTPLLRKLSELLDEHLYDPKTLISDLEEAGAVWLEKRRGFPYDYTVLLIDGKHPDIEAIQKDLYEREQRGEFTRPYNEDDEDDYPDDEYIDDEDDEYIDEEEDGYIDDEDDDYADEDLYSNGESHEDDEIPDDLAEEDEDLR